MSVTIRIDEGSRVQTVEYLTPAGCPPLVSICFEKNGSFVWLRLDPSIALALAPAIVACIPPLTLEAVA